MRVFVSMTVLAALAVLTCASATPAFAQRICNQLWVERNSIYKEAGYCFKTQRAIRYFGNSGCEYDNEGSLPLSRRDRARIGQILAEERANGCR